MTLRTKDKEIIVKNISNEIKNATSLIIANYDKITANKMNKLREKAFLNNITVKVIQNNLIKLAFKKNNINKLSKKIKGTTILLFSNKDIGSPARLFKKFEKYLKLKSIYIEEKIFNIEKLQEISEIPTRKQCIIKLNNIFKSSITKLIKTIKTVPLKLINTINIISKK